MIRTMPARPCPICRKPVSWETNPLRPFCSQRCKTLDLGAWASGAYQLPGESGQNEEGASEGASAPDMLDS
jgi:endogenous inhibitor of DNA gyrase (YacG/DUF329 family)